MRQAFLSGGVVQKNHGARYAHVIVYMLSISCYFNIFMI